jgi:hypothetical protein
LEAAHHSQSVDTVRRHHPSDQRADLQPRRGAAVGWHRQRRTGQLLQTHVGGQLHHRNQPSRPDQIRIIEPGVSYRDLCDNCIYEMLVVIMKILLSTVRFSLTRGHFACHDALTRTGQSLDPGLEVLSSRGGPSGRISPESYGGRSFVLTAFGGVTVHSLPVAC